MLFQILWQIFIDRLVDEDQIGIETNPLESALRHNAAGHRAS